MLKIIWLFEEGNVLIFGMFVILVWDNGLGVKFCCIFEFDDMYFFIIIDSVEVYGNLVFVLLFYV